MFRGSVAQWSGVSLACSAGLLQPGTAEVQQAEATRVRQLEMLKREVQRLCGEREQLKRERSSSASAPAAEFAVTMGMGGGERPMREEMRQLMASVGAAESAIAQEAAALSAKAASGA